LADFNTIYHNFLTIW